MEFVLQLTSSQLGENEEEEQEVVGVYKHTRSVWSLSCYSEDEPV